jgi:hypothetical protein
MKNSLLLLLFSLVGTSMAFACDRCGCSLSGHYLNALPQYQRHMAGVRWFYRGFASDHHGGVWSDERFHSLDVWGQAFPWERLQIIGVLPINYFTRTLESQHTLSRGLGDAVLLLNYNALRHTWGEGGAWKQMLWLGGGVKLPTGRFDADLVRQGINPNMQPGTGTLDGLLSGMYNLRHDRWGLAADALVRLSQTNSEGYRFGNRLNASGRFFYQMQTGATRWLPTAGAMYEWSAKDRHQGERTPETGGYCLLGHIGLDVYWDRFAVGVTGQIPMAQHLGNGYLQARLRVQVNVSALF